MPFLHQFPRCRPGGLTEFNENMEIFHFHCPTPPTKIDLNDNYSEESYIDGEDDDEYCVDFKYDEDAFIESDVLDKRLDSKETSKRPFLSIRVSEDQPHTQQYNDNAAMASMNNEDLVGTISVGNSRLGAHLDSSSVSTPRRGQSVQKNQQINQQPMAAKLNEQGSRRACMSSPNIILATTDVTCSQSEVKYLISFNYVFHVENKNVKNKIYQKRSH